MVQIIAENTSDNPIYESEIMVFDQGQINLCPKVQHEGKENIFNDFYLKAAPKLPVCNFTEKTMRQLHSIKLLGKDLHLLTRIQNRHSITFQYSIFKYLSDENIVKHYYQIYEFRNGAFTLLEKDNYNEPDNEFEKIFSFKKAID